MAWNKNKCKDLDNQTLSTTEVGGVTTEISISNGNTVQVNHPTDLDQQTLSTTVNPITGETETISISNGNTVNIVHPAGSGVNPSTLIPIPDNEVDTDIRTGQIGTSLDYARADHNHPIRRQSYNTYPLVTAFGTGCVITNTYNNGVFSDEESVTFEMTFRVTQLANNAWNGISIPNIGGFQNAQIEVAGVYHQTGNLTGMPLAPYMYNIATNYFNNNLVYIGEFRRNQATTRYVSIKIKYTRL